MGIPYWLVFAVALWSIGANHAQTNVLYETFFERAEGYDPALDLANQRGWVMQGSGGNGLIDGQFDGLGQQAYVGFTRPSDTNTYTSVWRPVNFNPVPANYPIVRFSVKLEIVLSTVGSKDDFRWSVYNSNGDRLFSIDFETSTGDVSYVLQDGLFVPTGSAIGFDGIYDLDVWMNFRRNLWTAHLNDFLLVNSQPLAQSTNTVLDFGDADAVWFIRGNPADAGDNFMAFDNYRITAEPINSIPGFVEGQGIATNGFFNLRAYGESVAKYSVDVTADFQQWFSLGEFDTNVDGIFDFEDTTSKGFQRGFYRLRLVP